MKFSFFIILFCCLFQVTSTNASHIMGGDITYKCVSSGQYEVQTRIYRDCNGLPLGNSILVNMASASCGTFSIVLPLISTHPQIITPTCSGTPDVCDGSAPANQGNYGIEEYIYRGIVDMNAAPINGCQDSTWILSWSQCCRNGAITTLQNPSSEGVFLYAKLDNTFNTSPCNSSPNFSTRPIHYFCLNQETSYAHGISDADGDSLAFSLINCLDNGLNDPVVYQGGLSGATPLIATGLTIDSITGAMTFTPTALQVGVICMLVEEYRNGIKIGESIRDMQFRVISCLTSPPTLTGLDGVFGGSFDTTVYAEDNLSFDVFSADADSLLETVTMFWNNAIDYATFTTDNSGTTPTGSFSWTPTNADVGLNTFTITVEDDACPLRAQNIFTYNINVLESPTLELNSLHTICTNSDSADLTVLIDSSQNWKAQPISYSWTPTTGLSNPNNYQTKASPDSNTLYTATVTFDNGNVQQISTFVEVISNAIDLSDIAVCQGQGQITTVNNASFNYINTDSIFIPDNDPIGAYVDIEISEISPIVINDSSIMNICFAANHFFAGNLDVFLVAPDGKTIELTTDNGGIGVPGAYADTTCFSMSATTLISTVTGNPPNLSGTYLPEESLHNLNGSPANGTWRLWVVDDAQGAPDYVSYFSIQFNNTITYSWSPSLGLSCTDCPNPTINVGQTTDFYLTTTHSVGCVDIDTMTVTYLPIDTTYLTVFTCDQSQTGVTSSLLSNQFECDSTVITNTVFIPQDTTILMVNTCDPQQAGSSTMVLNNVYGCDSVIITNTILRIDSTYITSPTCDSAQIGQTTLTLTNQFGCDSTIITNTILLPTDTTNLTAITCDSAQIGQTTLILTNQFGCDSMVITNTTYTAPPIPDFTVTSNFLEVTINNTTQNATNYSWDFGDGSPIVNSAFPTHTYDTSGTYIITLTASNPNCGSDTATFSIFVFAVGTDEIEMSNAITIFPNPNGGSFALKAENLALGAWKMSIYAVNGELLYEDILRVREKNFSKNYNIPTLGNGVYYIRLSSNNQLITKRIVVVK